MLINEGMLSTELFLNASASGATIEDLIAIYQIWCENHSSPKKIILGVDPWTFNKHHGQTRWHSIADAYYRFMNITPEREITPYQWRDIYSLSYFQSSLKKIPSVLRGQNEPIPTTKRRNAGNTRIADGSMSYAEAFSSSSTAEVDERVRLYLARGLYSIEEFSEISPSILSDFNSLIDSMLSKGIVVQLFLSPYHPKIYEVIEEGYPQVTASEKMLANLATKKNLSIVGSYNPGNLNVTGADFFDAMHCKENVIRKILADSSTNN